MAMSIEKAALYEKYRLPYSRQAVTDLLDHIGPVQIIADIGAGNGQLTRLFADRCIRIYAVEPDPAMRQVASNAFAGCATTQVVAGSAEQTTLAERSLDLIVIGNAFHRFKPEACAELRRILKPSQWIALFTYTLSNRALADLLFAKLSATTGVASRIDRAWENMPAHELFGEGHIHRRNYRQSRTDDWTTFFGAACAGLESPEPGDQDFGPFEALHREVFEEFSVDGAIRIEYETQVAFGKPVVQ
jgi:SAM-dependent methyltransferase